MGARQLFSLAGDEAFLDEDALNRGLQDTFLFSFYHFIKENHLMRVSKTIAHQSHL